MLFWLKINQKIITKELMHHEVRYKYLLGRLQSTVTVIGIFLFSGGCDTPRQICICGNNAAVSLSRVDEIKDIGENAEKISKLL